MPASAGVKRGKLYPVQGQIGGRNSAGNRRGRGALPSPRVGRRSRRATGGLRWMAIRRASGDRTRLTDRLADISFVREMTLRSIRSGATPKISPTEVLWRVDAGSGRVAQSFVQEIPDGGRSVVGSTSRHATDTRARAGHAPLGSQPRSLWNDDRPAQKSGPGSDRRSGGRGARTADQAPSTRSANHCAAGSSTWRGPNSTGSSPVTWRSVTSRSIATPRSPGTRAGPGSSSFTAWMTAWRRRTGCTAPSIPSTSGQAAVRNSRSSGRAPRRPQAVPDSSRATAGA
jgi:hypothetical protein